MSSYKYGLRTTLHMSTLILGATNITMDIYKAVMRTARQGLHDTPPKVCTSLGVHLHSSCTPS